MKGMLLESSWRDLTRISKDVSLLGNEFWISLNLLLWNNHKLSLIINSEQIIALHIIDRDGFWLTLWEIVILLFLRPWNKTLDKDYIYIKKDNSKPDDYCDSWLGKKTGRNKMTLNPNCFDYRSVMHQFFHSLGCAHENQRTDHEQYIRSQ